MSNQVEEEETEREKDLTKIAESVISNQLALCHNDIIRHTPYYKTNLKNALQKVIKHLEIAEEREYDLIDNTQEEATNELFNVRHKLINIIASVGIRYDEDLYDLIKAYKNDPMSMIANASRINKKHQNKRIDER